MEQIQSFWVCGWKAIPCFSKIGDSLGISSSSLQGLSNHLNGANRLLASRRSNYRFRKITAERDIQPEREGDLTLHSNGAGASNLIAAFLNDSKLEESIIEHVFLNAINRIMRPEAEFESIRVQQVIYNDQRVWEVFLQEKGFQ